MKFPAIDRRAHPADAVFSLWKTSDGWTLRRMDWPQPRGNTARGSILFANGRGDFIEKYLEPLDHWRRLGWNVTGFDWRGQGGSRGDIAAGHLDSFDSLLEDLEALVIAWAAETPGPHILIGHSMGGHLLLRLIGERQPPVAAAILVAPMIGINARPMPVWLSRTVSRIFAGLGLRERKAWKQNERPAFPGSSRQRFLTSCPDRYADEMWWKKRQPEFDLGPPSWGWLDAAFRSTAHFTPAIFGKIEIPILILGTDRDRLVSPTAIRRAAHLIPHAELHMFPTAAHELLRESDPVRLEALARIDSFLDRKAPQ